MDLFSYYNSVYTLMQEPIYDFLSEVSKYFDLFKRKFRYKILKNKQIDYDFEYWSSAFEKIYILSLSSFITIAVKQSKYYNKSIIQNLIFKYNFDYVIPISTYIARTNYKLLLKLKNKDNLTQEIVDRWFDFYNSYFRAQIITITESFRAFNFFYMYLSFYNNKTTKIFIAPPKNKCKLCSQLNGKKIYILDYFRIENKAYLHPPIHINNSAIIYCY